VVIKGANALDYKNKLAAVNILDPFGGTTGITMPLIVARKAHLVIPVGLEKLVAGDIVDLTLKMRETCGNDPSSTGTFQGEVSRSLDPLSVDPDG